MADEEKEKVSEKEDNKAEKAHLKSVKNFNEERDREILEMLESFREMAADGHLSDLCLIGKIRGADSSEILWDTENRQELIGALELAKAEVLDSLLDETRDEDDDFED